MHYAKYLATGYFDMYFYALLKLNSKVKLEHLLHIPVQKYFYEHQNWYFEITTQRDGV